MPEPPITDASERDLELLPLRDAAESGWFRVDQGELFRGFPIARGDLVLDIGCGDGGNTNFCLNCGARVLVADIDPAALGGTLRRVAGHGNPPLGAILTDSNPLPLRDGIADAIVCTEVIGHVADPVAFVAELVRVGKPGARYLLTVPDPVIEELQKPCAAPSYFEHPNHLRILQKDDFERLVTEAGLVVEARDTYGFYWSFWWLMAWAAGPNWPEDLQPLVQPWSRTWWAALGTPQGLQLKRLFDDLIPKSQLILARKPG